jgi:TetR/AcrR family tetracycline transcriptional repressor
MIRRIIAHRDVALAPPGDPRQHVGVPRADARSAGLTPGRIVRAALQELDDRGLAAFSIRNLANRLGVYPTAIYWHVKSRDVILAQVVAHILADVEPRRGPTWQGYLRALFANYRAAIKKHPNVAPLVGAHVLAALHGAGFAKGDLVAAYNTVIAALVGFVTQEFAPIPDDDRALWQSAVQLRLSEDALDDYPVLRENLPLLANRAFILRWDSGVQAPLDDSFERYVDVVIGGLEKLAPPKRR